MKNTFLIGAVFIAFTFSCSNDKKATIENPVTNSDNKTELKAAGKANLKEESTINLSEYSKLTPIEIKDSKQKDVFKKYGIEFGGVCYSCDLAIFKINKKSFDIVELCNEKNVHSYKDFSYEKKGNSLKIKTPEFTFIFTQVENEPIYQLKIEGQKPEFKNMRISEFYTQESLIEKFEEHDCGDFQG